MPNKISRLFLNRGFRPLTLNDREMVSSFFVGEGLGLSDYLFSMAYLWPAPGTILIKFIDSHLLVACAHRGKIDLLYPPLAAGKAGESCALNNGPAECPKACLTNVSSKTANERLAAAFAESAKILLSVRDEAQNAGIPVFSPRILSVPESKLGFLEMIPGASIHQDLSEYVYEREALLALSGSKYRNKRENINRFRKTYPGHTISEIRPEDSPALIKFLLEWYRLNKPPGTIKVSKLFSSEHDVYPLAPSKTRTSDKQKEADSSADMSAQKYPQAPSEGRESGAHQRTDMLADMSAQKYPQAPSEGRESGAHQGQFSSIDESAPMSSKNFFLESYLTRKYLKNFQHLAGTGLMIKVYDSIAGFIIGEKASSDTTIILIEKVNNDLFGLSQYLFREYIKAKVETKYVNSSDDAGSPGLKILKESYHPIEMRKKFFCILN